MTGELSQWEVDHEPEWSMWKDLAERIGGEAHAFDVYQGPYITVERGGERFKFWVVSDAGAEFLWEEHLNVRLRVTVWPDDHDATIDNLEYAADRIMHGDHPLISGKCPQCGNDLTSLEKGDGVFIPWGKCWTTARLDLKSRSTFSYETNWEDHAGIQCASCGHDVENDPEMEVEL